MYNILVKALDEALTAKYSQELNFAAEEKYAFSPEFEQKMNALIKRQRFSFGRIAKYMAVAACAALAVGCSVLLPRILNTSIPTNTEITTADTSVSMEAVISDTTTSVQTSVPAESSESSATTSSETTTTTAVTETPAETESVASTNEDNGEDDVVFEEGDDTPVTEGEAKPDEDISGNAEEEAPAEAEEEAAAEEESEEDTATDDDEEAAAVEDDEEDAAVEDNEEDTAADEDEEDATAEDDEEDAAIEDDDGDDAVDVDDSESEDDCDIDDVDEYEDIPRLSTFGEEAKELMGVPLSESYVMYGTAFLPDGSDFPLAFGRYTDPSVYRDKELCKLMEEAELVEAPEESSLGNQLFSLTLVPSPDRIPVYDPDSYGYDCSFRNRYKTEFGITEESDSVDDVDDEVDSADTNNNSDFDIELQITKNGYLKVRSFRYKDYAYYKLSDKATEIIIGKAERLDIEKPETVGDVLAQVGSSDKWFDMTGDISGVYDVSLSCAFRNGAEIEKILKKYSDVKLKVRLNENYHYDATVYFSSETNYSNVSINFGWDGNVCIRYSGIEYLFRISEEDFKAVLSAICKAKGVEPPVFYKTFNDYVEGKHFDTLQEAELTSDNKQYLLTDKNKLAELKKLIDSAGKNSRYTNTGSSSIASANWARIRVNGWGPVLTLRNHQLCINSNYFSIQEEDSNAITDFIIKNGVVQDEAAIEEYVDDDVDDDVGDDVVDTDDEMLTEYEADEGDDVLVEADEATALADLSAGSYKSIMYQRRVLIDEEVSVYENYFTEDKKALEELSRTVAEAVKKAKKSESAASTDEQIVVRGSDDKFYWAEITSENKLILCGNTYSLPKGTYIKLKGLFEAATDFKGKNREITLGESDLS